MEKKFRINGSEGDTYEIVREDKATPVRYLVTAASRAQAHEICDALAADTLAAVDKYEIDVCKK